MRLVVAATARVHAYVCMCVIRCVWIECALLACAWGLRIPADSTQASLPAKPGTLPIRNPLSTLPRPCASSRHGAGTRQHASRHRRSGAHRRRRQAAGDAAGFLRRRPAPCSFACLAKLV
ncbi:MAG: hypothetical protein J3K34DRAFT_442458 [Monoraphidium minutum]|nr:MAG: hypothetical protein J3K34DRAFT_442458 [Monoraphidium minutum]